MLCFVCKHERRVCGLELGKFVKMKLTTPRSRVMDASTPFRRASLRDGWYQYMYLKSWGCCYSLLLGGWLEWRKMMANESFEGLYTGI